MTTGTPVHPVAWYDLITEMEAFTRRTGWGLASVWGHVHRLEYDQALALLDDLADAERRGEIPQRATPRIMRPPRVPPNWTPEPSTLT